MVICLVCGADLHMAQLMPLPLTVCCFSKIQIGFTFLVPAHPGSPRKGPLNRFVIYCRDGKVSNTVFSCHAWNRYLFTNPFIMSIVYKRVWRLAVLCKAMVLLH